MKRVPKLRDMMLPDPDSPYTDHGLIRVHLANGRSVYFRSKRDAQAFAADTRRFLEQTMLEANALLGTALQEHRNAWPILGDIRSKELSTADPELREALAVATDMLDRCTPTSAGADGLYHAWRHVRTCLGKLSTCFAILERVYQYKTMGVLRWRMANQVQHCSAALERLANYAEKPAYGRPG